MRIFKIHNTNKHKVVEIFGIKIKFKVKSDIFIEEGNPARIIKKDLDWYMNGKGEYIENAR